ncbi:MAG: AraC family transcriptional regulator [Chlamydiales bacterium]|nr:AraC family transcriptional regulator [Chlamydiales bacterium]
MDYTTKKTDRKYMIGIELKTCREDGRAEREIPAHWERFFKEGVAAKIPHKVSDDTLALYTDYEGDATKPYSMIIGCEVSKIDEIPEGMVAKTIPRARYAIVKAMGPFPEALIKTWKKIWTSALKRTYTGDFEVYPAGFHPQNNPEVKLHIAIK